VRCEDLFKITHSNDCGRFCCYPKSQQSHRWVYRIGGGYFVPSVPVGDKRDGEFQNAIQLLAR
jgi:hypothetical protein